MDFNFYQDEINKLTTKLLASTQQQRVQRSEQHTIHLIDQKIHDMRDRLDDIEIQLKESRIKWNEYLVLIEDSEQLQQDLNQLFSRIEQEAETFKQIMREVRVQVEGMRMFFDLTIDNEICSKDYEH